MKRVGLPLGMLALATAVRSDPAAADGVLDAARLLSGGSQASSGPSIPAHVQTSRSWSPVTWHYYRPAPPAYHRARSGGSGTACGQDNRRWRCRLGIEPSGDLPYFDRDVKPDMTCRSSTTPRMIVPCLTRLRTRHRTALDSIQKPLYQQPLMAVHH